MRIAKMTATALFILAISTTGPLAFHDAGVAECAGCHTMHNSQDGVPVDPAHPAGNAYLLQNANSTDQCLACHASYGQFFGGEGYGPGGDFYWLTKTFEWTSHGHAAYSTGDSHGHNVISPANMIAADATLLAAPGGTFDSDFLTCTSCHDPHGNQNFRILYGDGVVNGPGGPIYLNGRYDFEEAAPLAKGNSRKTMVGGGGEETDARHTVYKSGMTEWCANCHGDFHSGETTDSVHPTSVGLGAGIAAVYNAYVSTDDPAGGDAGTAYFGLVPFEDVDVDLGTVDSADYTAGPAAGDQVMCLTCHRAHASAFPDAARWDLAETFLADSHPQLTDTGASADDVANMYYQYTFVQNQRSLCNKCHMKDGDDGPY
jgi:hypothetical protein